ncbi:serine/threonine-protein kinase [Psychrobacter faecalis]|uniref:serine/threonine-protein kinase n=1 Tax=Psychrobacter faecalis TaxID=180588 RepID=UPI003FD65259
MKNSASNQAAIQAKPKQDLAKQTLQTDMQQILPALTAEFLDLQYNKIVHQRISQQGVTNALEYQGLTRAKHPQFGEVMMKWQLSTDAHRNVSDLSYEAEVVKTINHLSNHQGRFSSIAAPLLATHHLQLQVLNNSQTLTILVMPNYANGSVARYLKQSLTAEQKQQLIIQAAKLIANLHHIGWLHNDIKPSNILLDTFVPNHTAIGGIVPNLLLTDFALAEPINNGITQRNKKNCTENNAGTPAYLAPERWQGQGATLQSDIYAFGIMLYEILTGMRPFNIANERSERLKEWATQHCQQPIATLPLEYSRYQRIINKALAKRIEKRYQSMEEIVMGLKRL